MRAPEFWGREHAPLALPLAPLALAWTAAGRARRALVRPHRAPVPVVCVGNLVAGGAGKTPTALAVLRALAARGRTAHALTRGYGGGQRGPLRVVPGRHDARAVGDEALLLAVAAPTWVARDRVAGAAAAADGGARVVVMDDGFQNPSLHKDLSLLVVDGAYGLGNGRVIPAGPLREPAEDGFARASAVVLLGADERGLARRLPEAIPRLGARLVPEARSLALSGKTVFAFAGIGRPAKFYATLREMGCRIVGTRDFPDHHDYAPDEIMALCEAAHAAGAVPVTTEKDAVRLPAGARAMVEVLAVALRWEDESALERVLAPVLG